MGDDAGTTAINYNRQQLLGLAKGMSGFKHLAKEVDGELAKAVTDLIFDAQVRETNPDGKYIQIASAKRAEYADQINLLLLTECAQIRLKRNYATELLESAKAEELRGLLAENTEPEKNYVLPRRRLPHGNLEREILKAGDWVAQSFRDNRGHVAHEILTRHVVTSPQGKALGRNLELLDQIHFEIAPEAPKSRSPKINTAYPSSIGGRFLLEMIFKWTSMAFWPGAGDEQWLDVALFYLGAIATVQGYADANKRTARMAYAIILLKGGCPFVAPNPGLEGHLIRMMHEATE
jgi:hypothetical protein